MLGVWYASIRALQLSRIQRVTERLARRVWSCISPPHLPTSVPSLCKISPHPDRPGLHVSSSMRRTPSRLPCFLVFYPPVSVPSRFPLARKQAKPLQAKHSKAGYVGVCSIYPDEQPSSLRAIVVVLRGAAGARGCAARLRNRNGAI